METAQVDTLEITITPAGDIQLTAVLDEDTVSSDNHRGENWRSLSL